MFFLDMQNKIGLLFGCEITTCAFEHRLLSGRTNFSCHFTQTSHSSNRIVSSWNMCLGACGNCRNTSPDPRLLCHPKHFLCILSLPLLSAIPALGVMIKEPLTAFFHTCRLSRHNSSPVRWPMHVQRYNVVSFVLWPARCIIHCLLSDVIIFSSKQ